MGSICMGDFFCEIGLQDSEISWLFSGFIALVIIIWVVFSDTIK